MHQTIDGPKAEVYDVNINQDLFDWKEYDLEDNL